jgi:hypothetical protein
MMDRISRRAAILVASGVVMAAGAAVAAERKPDLGDAAAGTYYGDVISDSKGSSKSGVTLTITRTGPNLVTVSSDYARLPKVHIPLTRAMGTIVQQSGDSVFVLDKGKLDVSFNNEVSWSGQKQ